MSGIALRLAAIRIGERALHRSAGRSVPRQVRHAATAVAPEPDEGEDDFFVGPASSEPGPSTPRKPSEPTPKAALRRSEVENWVPGQDEGRLSPRIAAGISVRRAMKDRVTQQASQTESVAVAAKNIALQDVKGKGKAVRHDPDDFFADPQATIPDAAGRSQMSSEEMEEALALYQGPTEIAARPDDGDVLETWDPLADVKQKLKENIADVQDLDVLPVNIDPYDVPLDPAFPSATTIVRQVLTDHKFLRTLEIYEIATEGLRPITMPRMLFTTSGQIRVKQDGTRREIYREHIAMDKAEFPSHPFQSRRSVACP